MIIPPGVMELVEQEGVQSSEIDDGAITTAKLAAASVTAPKLAVQAPIEIAGTVASPTALTQATHGGRILVNNDSAKAGCTLPTGADTGTKFFFRVVDANGFRINAGTGQTIRINGTASSSGGYIESTTVGSFVALEQLAEGEWQASVVSF